MNAPIRDLTTALADGVTFSPNQQLFIDDALRRNLPVMTMTNGWRVTVPVVQVSSLQAVDLDCASHIFWNLAGSHFTRAKFNVYCSE